MDEARGRTRVHAGAATLVASALIATAATAQGPDMNQLAIGWAVGSYAAPLVCEIAGEPQRGLRRLAIGPGPRGSHRIVGRIEFSDLEAGEASRCFDEMGRRQPNLVGWVDIHLPGHSRPDTAERDFKTELRRGRGFTFEITGSRLRIEPIGSDAGPPRLLDLRGGEAKLELLLEGMDETRLLADFSSPRKLVLRLRPRAGKELVFPIFYTETGQRDRKGR